MGDGLWITLITQVQHLEISAATHTVKAAYFFRNPQHMLTHRQSLFGFCLGQR